MPERLYHLLLKRYEHRDESKPWVFWHRYWGIKIGEFVEGPFKDRKRIMTTLCRKACVRYFRFHALRHLGASMLERAQAPLGDIQRLLGHENRTTTEIYLHSTGESERKAMSVLGREILTDSHTKSHTESSRRRAHALRPLTPPYVRFRIRRFMVYVETSEPDPVVTRDQFDQRSFWERQGSCVLPQSSTRGHGH